MQLKPYDGPKFAVLADIAPSANEIYQFMLSAIILGTPFRLQFSTRVTSAALTAPTITMLFRHIHLLVVAQ